jgi:hypothetical protein
VLGIVTESLSLSTFVYVVVSEHFILGDSFMETKVWKVLTTATVSEMRDSYTDN